MFVKGKHKVVGGVSHITTTYTYMFHLSCS